MEIVLIALTVGCIVLATWLVRMQSNEEEARKRIEELVQETDQLRRQIRDLLRTRRRATRERFLGLIEENARAQQ